MNNKCKKQLKTKSNETQLKAMKIIERQRKWHQNKCYEKQEKFTKTNKEQLESMKKCERKYENNYEKLTFSKMVKEFKNSY